MDYKELIKKLRTESLYIDKATLEIMDLCMEAATAITDLLAENLVLRNAAKDFKTRAEAAEARAEVMAADNERLREAMRPNCLKCHYRHPDNGNCTAVGGFCTAVLAAHCPLIPELLDRAEAAEACAEKAERERDAAIKDIMRAEAAAEAAQSFLDNELHPAVDYYFYLGAFDCMSDIINWQYDDIWRKPGLTDGEKDNRP